MAKPRLLDLFCGSGGCATGYSRAGFDIVGVDLNKSRLKYYPFEHHHANALEFVAAHGKEFDVIHASPPCQAYSSLNRLPQNAGKIQVDLVDETREALKSTGKIWVIENVYGAPLIFPALICGSYFGLGVRRHRYFESNVLIFSTVCDHKKQGRPMGVYGRGGRANTEKRRNFGYRATKAEAIEAMQIDWMPHCALTQAIPPAYTQFIGEQLINILCNQQQ